MESNKVIAEGTSKEVIELINQSEKLFLEATSLVQWNLCKEYDNGIELHLYEDRTEVVFTEESNSLRVPMKESIGIGQGVQDLLTVLEINYIIKQNDNDE